MSDSLKGRQGHLQSEETKQKIRESAIKNELGGHTSKKQIFYVQKDGSTVYLQSSFEIKVAIELDDNNIEWIRPKYIIWTDKNNINHRYYADFYLPKYNVYLDPKNSYLQIKDKEKIDSVEKQNNVKIFILSENELCWQSIKTKISPL